MLKTPNNFGDCRLRTDWALKHGTSPMRPSVDQVRGQFVVTLENGQVWRQTDSKDVFYSAKRGVEEATIKSAALGSYMMKFDDGVLFRVERVK